MPARFDDTYFSRFYRDYRHQNPPHKLAFYRRLVEASLPAAQPHCSLLDAGCGPGLFVASLPAGWDRFGIDPAASVIASSAREYTDVQFCAGSLDHLPFSRRFSVITAFDVIEHIADLEAVAAQVRAHLLPDGLFCFAVPVYDGPVGWLVDLLDKDTTHVHRRSRHFWLRWAGRHFGVVKWTGAVRYLIAGKLYLHLPTRLLRSVSPAICVVARQLPA